MSSEELTLVLRGVAVGLALAFMLAGFGLQRRARLALVPVLACLVAYLLRSAPQTLGWPIPALVPLAVGATLFPVAFWWLVHSAFEDRADVPSVVWAAAAVMLAAGFLGRPVGAALTLAGDGPHALQKAVAAGFVLAGLWRLWRSGDEDLVARRRVLRGWLLLYIGAHGLIVLAVELWLRETAPPAWLDALNVAAIGLALSVTLALLLGFRAAAIDAMFGLPAPVTAAVPPASAMPADSADSADAIWLQRLQEVMTNEHAYRDAELSVATLATGLGLPEYRLRELINRSLGYRNFPAFVNAHRLREVERRLLDPGCDRRPILTLALEAGFGSIGPFNRAFRERHGVSPSEYRAMRGAANPAV